MKIKIIILFTIQLGLLFSFNNASIASYSKSDALIVTDDKTIYVDVSNNSKFSEELANPYLYYFDGQYAIIRLEKINSFIYKTANKIPSSVLIDSDYWFEICCYGGITNECTTATIYGGSLLKEQLYDYIILDEYISNQNSNIKGYGNHSKKTPNPEQATYKTQRIWVFDEKKEDSGSKLVISYFDPVNNDIKFIEMRNTINTYDNRTYQYVDIPINVFTFQLLRMNNYIINYNYGSTNIMYGLCYFLDETNIVTSEVFNATAHILGMVVEAYLTFGQNDSNGSVKQTVKNLYDTWFKNKSATNSDLNDKRILDYTGYAVNNNSYEGLEKNRYYTVNEKWQTMCSQAGIDPRTGKERNAFINWLENNKLIIFIVSGILIIAFVIYAIIKKKKEDK